MIPGGETTDLRAAVAPPSSPPSLTARQAAVLSEITRYQELHGECRASWLAARLSISRNTVLEHAAALHRKGWLRSKESPFRLRRRD